MKTGSETGKQIGTEELGRDGHPVEKKTGAAEGVQPFPAAAKYTFRAHGRILLYRSVKSPFMTRILPKGWSIMSRCVSTIRAAR